MKLFLQTVFALFLTTGNAFSQQLIINEISQGTGAKEYVEFVVVGISTCQTPVPCADLRGVILDDNNGYFSPTASGSGIASGAIRFANIAFWSCIPQGTIIVIYNNNDINPALPANDVSMTDGNCRLIFSANSMLLEGQSISPSSSNPYVYPPSGWVAGAGNWNQVAMSNSNDSFQIRANSNSSTPSYSVSWGNNTVNSTVYFSSALGAVFSITNNSGINPSLQSNWTLGSVGVNETPGAGNNTANSVWISSMNPQCGVGAPSLQVSLSQTNESCPTLCDGTITSTVTNGVGPYTYSWSNGAISANLTNLCPNTYVVQVTDQNGCTTNASATILAGMSSGNPTIQAAGPFSTIDAAYQLTAATMGGVWSSNCGTCLNAFGVFSPSVSGAGTFEICYTLGAGSCATTDCINIIVSNCPPQFTNETISICPGTTATVFGQQVGVAGIYSEQYTDINLCDSTHTIQLQIFTVNTPINSVFTMCEGDSIEVYGTWIYEDLYLEQIIVDLNGCSVENSATVIVNNCVIEEFNLYIPNVFTPNNDGVNDFFTIELEGGYLNEGYIINRWGETIANFDNANKTWSGKTTQGQTVVDGVYTYLIYYTPNSQNKQTVQGFVTVVR